MSGAENSGSGGPELYLGFARPRLDAPNMQGTAGVGCSGLFISCWPSHSAQRATASYKNRAQPGRLRS